TLGIHKANDITRIIRVEVRGQSPIVEACFDQMTSHKPTHRRQYIKLILLIVIILAEQDRSRTESADGQSAAGRKQILESGHIGRILHSGNRYIFGSGVLNAPISMEVGG